MKRANVILLLTLSLGLGVGCKKNPKSVTEIPGASVTVGDPANGTKGPGYNPDATTTAPIRPLTNIDRPLNGTGLEGGPGARPNDPGSVVEDRQTFSGQVVYFEFDRATIKASERTKLDEVATQLKADPNITLKVEGHCDERGTEEYNRALGERRALAAMNYLAQAGVDSSRLTTVSFGEDKPAAQGTDESAYSQNRRAEFVILLGGR